MSSARWQAGVDDGSRQDPRIQGPRIAPPADALFVSAARWQSGVDDGPSQGPRIQGPRIAPSVDSLLVSFARWQSGVDDGSRQVQELVSQALPGVGWTTSGTATSKRFTFAHGPCSLQRSSDDRSETAAPQDSVTMADNTTSASLVQRKPNTDWFYARACVTRVTPWVSVVTTSAVTMTVYARQVVDDALHVAARPKSPPSFTPPLSGVKDKNGGRNHCRHCYASPTPRVANAARHHSRASPPPRVVTASRCLRLASPPPRVVIAARR